MQMPRRRGLLAIIVGLSSIALVFALAGGAAAGKKKKTVKRFAPDMVGAVDVPPGDPDGSGEASFKLKKAKKRVCFNISFQGIDNPTDGHIHEGAPGVAGEIVVPLFTGTPGLPSPISGCVKAKRSLIKQIAKHPGDFYVNIHNDAFPGGALRDQLQKKSGGGSSGGGGGGGTPPY
jgi:CHRD domain